MVRQQASRDGSFPPEQHLPRSRVCGQSVLTKLLSGRPHQPLGASLDSSHIPDDGQPILKSRSFGKLAKISASSYEEIPSVDPSAEKERRTEEANEKSAVIQAPSEQFLQFNPPVKSKKKDLPSRVTSIKSTVGMLPALNEGIDEDASLGQSLDDEEKRNDRQQSTGSSSLSNTQSELLLPSIDLNLGADADESTVVKSLKELVVQQQATLKAMSTQNHVFRRRLDICQSTFEKMKVEHTNQKNEIEKLTIEKESFESEAMWLREEIQTIREELNSLRQQALARNKEEVFESPPSNQSNRKAVARSIGELRESPPPNQSNRKAVARSIGELRESPPPNQSNRKSVARSIGELRESPPPNQGSTSRKSVAFLDPVHELERPVQPSRQSEKVAGNKKGASVTFVDDPKQPRFRSFPDLDEMYERAPAFPAATGAKYFPENTTRHEHDELRTFRRDSRDEVRESRDAASQDTRDSNRDDELRRDSSDNGSQNSSGSKLVEPSSRKSDEVALYKYRLEMIQKNRQRVKQRMKSQMNR